MPRNLLPIHLRSQKSIPTLPTQLLPLHRTKPRSRYPLPTHPRKNYYRRRQRMARNPRLRYGSPSSPQKLWPRPQKIPRFRLRNRCRTRRHAQIRNSRPTRLHKWSHPLAPTLRLPRHRHTLRRLRTPSPQILKYLPKNTTSLPLTHHHPTITLSSPPPHPPSHRTKLWPKNDANSTKAKPKSFTKIKETTSSSTSKTTPPPSTPKNVPP